MKLIKVAAAVLNQTPLDWHGNKARILAAIAKAHEDGVSILCLPELCISGYGCEDAFLSTGVQAMAWRVLKEIVPATKGMIVSLGLPVLYNHGLFNMACLAVDGRIVGFVAKRFLAGDGIHYEPRWFKPWPIDTQVELQVGAARFPAGDISFNCGGVRVGFEICEDAWVANRPGAKLSTLGVDVILNPSASHFAFGKSEVRRRFVLEGSRAFSVTYVYSNLLGNEAGRAIYDGGALIATSGKLVAAGSRFSFADFEITSAVVDIDATGMQQSRTSSYSPSVAAHGKACVDAPFSYPSLTPVAEKPVIASWEDGDHVKEEEFTRSISLGLFDYMRKSRSRGFVVSLSGGADSAAVAALSAMSARHAISEIGWNAYREKLAYWKELQTPAEPPDLISMLLVCAYQSTGHSSDTTRNAASSVAKGVSATFFDLDVDEIAKKYVEIVSKALGRDLSWKTDDIALQNIQARTRSPSIWLITNVRGALLLSTSNRSEAAVGYATMDGDTSGGLSPIAGIDKAFLRRWLRWLEKTGPHGGRAYPELAPVNVQAPTAELRPPENHQTDEDDLMPYELLDAIERAAIRDKLIPLEVFQRMRAEFAQYKPPQLLTWVERFFLLWSRNQWKRERYAPSFHVDDENLDPKTWCRFPVLSGGFQRELEELRAWFASSYPGLKRSP